jgi:hypothetical protein
MVAPRTVEPPLPVRTAGAGWVIFEGSYIVASERRDLGSFRRADRGLVQRGQMIPAGRLHAVQGDKTLCGLPLRGLYIFPQLRFRGAPYVGYQCPVCQVAAGLR